MTEIRKNKALQIFKQKYQYQYKVILIAGNDKGQVQIITNIIEKSFLEQNNKNKMAIKYLNANLWDQYENALIEHSKSPSIFASKFILKINELKPKLTQIIKKYLENSNPKCLIIIQTDSLPPANSLRKLAYTNNQIAYIPCYETDVNDNILTIKKIIAQNGKDIEQDAALIMAQNIGADQILTNNEINKLLLFCQNEKIIKAKHVEQIIIDSSTLQIENICDLIMNAQKNNAIKKFERLIYNGINENHILALMIKHLIMIQKLLYQIKNGTSIQNAIKTYRPTIFFKRQYHIAKQCENWQINEIAVIINKIAKTQADIRKGQIKPLNIIKRFIIETIKIAELVNNR